ncbi:MAG: hypothetical protein RLZ44_660 [Pseudomonadota bacterium]
MREPTADKPTPPDQQLRDWTRLRPDEQLALREAFGRYLDSLPPTCSLETKIARFQRWLAERGVHYEHPG